MKIIAVDDEQMMLEELVDAIHAARPEADVAAFQFPQKALAYINEIDHLDAAFLDVEMGVMNGIECAKKVKEKFPLVNIIFVTGYDKYMKEAFAMHSSGYVTKPINGSMIKTELDNLRNPLSEVDRQGFTAHCFGTFEISQNGETLKFDRSKTKEMLAYLIDRHGASVTSGELCAVLWEDKDADKGTNHYLQILKKDLIDSLKRIGEEDFFQYSRNEYRIDPMMIQCDYYDYLDNKPQGVWAYNGEYMTQYSWGENRNSWIMYRKL